METKELELLAEKYIESLENHTDMEKGLAEKELNDFLEWVKNN